MRDSMHRDNAILTSDDGKVIAFVLAADFCSEHEWGIRELKSKLGLPERPECFADNCLKAPFDLRYVDDGDNGIIATTSTDTYNDNDAKGYGDVSEYAFLSAWDSRNFMIRSVNKDSDFALEQLISAFGRGDIAVFLGGGGVFQNAGLVIAIASNVPQEQKDAYDAACEDRRKLKQCAEATGIYNRIEKRAYFALSPAWNDRENGTKMREETQYGVVFWLNPTDQRHNNSGWFTVEELDQWLEGKGPVPRAEPDMNRY